MADEFSGRDTHEEFPLPPFSDEIWKLILDRSKVPEIMVHTLKGEVWIVDEERDGSVGGHWEKRGDALMNERGVRYFASFLFSAMSPDKLATNLSQLEVYDRAREMSKTIILLVAERGDEFGIDAANRTYLVRLLDDFYFMNLTASRGGTILNALKQVYERKETYTPEKRQQNPMGLDQRQTY